MQPGSYAFDLVQGHCLIHHQERVWLLDTGSPLTLEAPRLVRESLGTRVDMILGTDVLSRHPFTLDYRTQTLVVHDGAAPPTTKWQPLRTFLGVFTTAIRHRGQEYTAILDTGAWLSYAPASVTTDVRREEAITDFHPTFGTFTVDTFNLSVDHDGRVIPLRCGVLPPLFAMALQLVTPDPWILGWEFLKDRVWLFDLGGRRFADVTPPERVNAFGKSAQATASAHSGTATLAASGAPAPAPDWLDTFIRTAASWTNCFDYRCGTCGASRFFQRLFSTMGATSSRVPFKTAAAMQIAEGLRHVRQDEDVESQRYIVMMLLLAVWDSLGEARAATELPPLLQGTWAGEVLQAMQEHARREVERLRQHLLRMLPKRTAAQRAEESRQAQAVRTARKAEIDAQWWSSNRPGPEAVAKRALRTTKRNQESLPASSSTP
ncbi:MAG: hypothetical protein U0163_19190 [Gemmatimonadaceae bacterium]